MNSGMIPPPGSIESAKQNLVKDLATIAADGGAILNGVVRSAANEVAQARSSLEAGLCQAKSRLVETGAAVGERARHTAAAAGAYVRENPWKTIGIAAAAGLLIGALVRRRE